MLNTCNAFKETVLSLGHWASQLLLRESLNPNPTANALHSLGFVYKPPEITYLKDKKQTPETCLEKEKGSNVKHEDSELSPND